jgi:hypothetical protein
VYLQLLARWPMNLLLTLVLSAVLAGPAQPDSVAPDSSSVAFTTTKIWLRETPLIDGRRVALLPPGAQVKIIQCRKEACRVQFRHLQGYVAEEHLRTTPPRNPVDPGRGYGEWDALALLMSEHRLSVPIFLIERNFSPSGPNVAAVP